MKKALFLFVAIIAINIAHSREINTQTKEITISSGHIGHIITIEISQDIKIPAIPISISSINHCQEIAASNITGHISKAIEIDGINISDISSNIDGIIVEEIPEIITNTIEITPIERCAATNSITKHKINIIDISIV